MKSITRRDFVKSSIAMGAAMAAPFSKARGANGDIRVGVVGFRGKGRHHIEMLRENPGVRIAALCDADREVIDSQVKQFKERNEAVKTYVDIRKLLDDDSIDAIVTATPNHWHALLTIWACQAGKDVYVEKPVSHNIWEGRKMVEAARKYRRIVQTGTQSRSGVAPAEAFKYIHEGNLGKILVARGFCYKRRTSIGKVKGPQALPESIDYNIWTGPAPLKPLMREQLHYDWHWVWDTGNGDIGNQGVHEMDLCRWALGQDKLPPRVMSIGGRFGYDDDGETANTQIAIFDYKPAPLIFEVRGLPNKKPVENERGAMDNYRGVRVGVVIECENGYYAGGGGGGWIYDNNHNKVKQFVGGGRDQHQANFFEAVRSRKVSDLNADILEGHLSSGLCHMANISYRLGAAASQGQIRDALQGNKAAMDSLERFEQHMAANEIDLKKALTTLGAWLTMDTEKEQFVGEWPAFWANELLTRPYRKPFVVPENV